MNFSSNGSQYECTVGDYLSIAHSSGLVGLQIGNTVGAIKWGVIGGLSAGGPGFWQRAKQKGQSVFVLATV